MNKIFITLCGCLAVLMTQDSYSNSSEKNQQLCNKYKNEIQTLYKIVKRDEYNAIKLYDNSEMDLDEVNIFYSKTPENDKYYKLKVMFNEIKFETWKHLHYNIKVTSRVEFYENIIKRLKDLQNTYNSAECTAEDGKVYRDSTHYRFYARVEFLIERCSKILNVYKNILDIYKQYKACKS